MVEVGDVVNVKIEAANEKGDGLTQVNGLVIFVPNTREGDEVKIKVTRVLRKVGFGEILDKTDELVSTEDYKKNDPEVGFKVDDDIDDLYNKTVKDVLGIDLEEKEKEEEYLEGVKERSKERRREKLKEYHRAYYKRPEVKKRKREYYKNYNQKPEVKKRNREYSKKYYNKPKVKERYKKYYQKNKILKNEYKKTSPTNP